MEKKLIFLFLALLFITKSYGQNIDMAPPESQMEVIAKSYGNSIVLRWGTERWLAFADGVKKGYKIERKNLSKNSNWEIIEEQVLPWKDTSWVKHSEKLNTNLGKEDSLFSTVMYLYLGLTGQTGSQIQTEVEDKNNVYAMILLSATRRADIASAIGQRFVDKNIEKNTRYAYRVSYLGNSIYTVFPSEVEISSTVLEPGKQKHTIKGAEKRIHINFPPPKNIISFYVLRSESRSGKYINLTPNSRTMLYANGVEDTAFRFTDTGLINYESYYYKVFGNDAFGDTILLFSAKGYPRDMTPPKRVIIEEINHNLKGGYVQLKWKPMTPVASDLYGFDIYRSDSINGPWVKINSRTIRKKYNSYKDYKFSSSGKNYYYISAKDTAGNFKNCEPGYAFVYDITPPETPEWIEGTMDTSGIVTLKIKPGTENDLMGYRLFMANKETHEFSPIGDFFKDSANQKVQTIFYDTTTLRTLTNSIFYQIKAYDFRFNESDYSKVLTVKRIDTIPPTTPSFIDLLSNNTGITLKFNPSESLDLKTQYLYRRSEYDSTWTKVIELDAKANYYIDTTLVPNKRYYYCLRSEDESGNLSKFSFPVYGNIYNKNMQSLITSLNLEYVKEQKTLKITWEAKLDKSTQQPYRYVLYRKVKDLLVEYKNTKQESFYEIKNVRPGDYGYAVKIFFADGTESKLSELKTITIKN